MLILKGHTGKKNNNFGGVGWVEKSERWRMCVKTEIEGKINKSRKRSEPPRRLTFPSPAARPVGILGNYSYSSTAESFT